MPGRARTASAPTAALLAALLVAPARGGKLVDDAAYINCKASTTCTKMCAGNARAARPEPIARADGRPARLHAPKHRRLLRASARPRLLLG